MLKSSLGKRLKNIIMKKMMMSEKQDEYKQKLTEHLQERVVSSDEGLDSRWKKITRTSHKTAEEVFGKTSRKQSNVWFDKECQDVTEGKNKAYSNMQQQSYTRASTDKYREAQRKEKQVHKRKKKQYENNQIEKLEELGQQNQIRQFYRDINKLRKGFKLRLTICKIRAQTLLRKEIIFYTAGKIIFMSLSMAWNKNRNQLKCSIVMTLMRKSPYQQQKK
jgi:glutamate synthase domain-containing protein 2